MVKFDIKLEEDKEFMQELKHTVVSIVTDLLRTEKMEILLASAISRYFSYYGREQRTFEDFTEKKILELIVSSTKDESSLPLKEKAENVVVQLLRNAINDFVREKLKDVKITGIEI